MKRLEKLFTPIKIGAMELKNRCVQAPMYVNMSDPDGRLSDREMAYYAARAKGGFALLQVGVVSVHPLGKAFPNCPELSDDKYVSGWERLAKAVHAFGTKLAPQLQDAGNKVFPDLPGVKVRGPSPLSYPTSRTLPTSAIDTPVAAEFSQEEINELIEAYGNAAVRAREAGCDAVAIHGGHGYQLAQFMSPAENHRTDEWGGGIEGRLKFSLQVIKTIRSKVGDFPIIFRIVADEMIPGGLSFQESQVMCWLLTNAGVDCLDISRGSLFHSIHTTVPSIGEPPAQWVTESTWLIKQAVDIPVMAVGRIVDPHVAEFLIDTGKCDLVAFGRASLADPELPNKAASGRFEDIIYCNGCDNHTGTAIAERIRGNPAYAWVCCAFNPETGHEFDKGIMPAIAPAAMPKKVLVAGGGPAGLESARVAALRGHDVTLCEKSGRLGGQLWIGSLPPGKQELTRGIKHLITQAAKAGVKIEVNKEVTPALVDKLNPDAVIVATGGAPLIPKDILGIHKPHVFTAHDVLTERVRCGYRVVVLGANMVGCEVADWLGIRRKEVTLIKRRPGPMANVGEDVPMGSRASLLDRLQQWKVKVITGPKQGITIKAITDEGVVIIRDGQQEFLECDNVVLALGTVPVNQLAEQLKGKVAEIRVIGDAKQPARAIDAIHEGSKVGREL
jgi:2,4-dienoyl-CoA reductase-like NADH-dependent reductase (Old Yellow Enzyme family)/thioredoxin reductase